MRFYRLHELADATGVTPRTIRYYIAEGLLPTPQGAGPAALYTVGHRDRLRLIAQLKNRAIPLREIRRRIAKLTDAKVLAELDAAVVADEASEVAGAQALPPAPVATARDAQRIPATAPSPALTPQGERWERFIIADGIELHVRDDRRHGRLLLDTLVCRARDLFGDS